MVQTVTDFPVAGDASQSRLPIAPVAKCTAPNSSRARCAVTCISAVSQLRIDFKLGQTPHATAAVSSRKKLASTRRRRTKWPGSGAQAQHLAMCLWSVKCSKVSHAVRRVSAPAPLAEISLSEVSWQTGASRTHNTSACLYLFGFQLNERADGACKRPTRQDTSGRLSPCSQVCLAFARLFNIIHLSYKSCTNTSAC